MVKCEIIEPPPVEKTVVLTMSYAEAQALRELFGNSATTGELNKIYNALCIAGVDRKNKSTVEGPRVVYR